MKTPWVRATTISAERHRFALLVLLGGCYKYVPIEAGAPGLARGDPVRVRLDRASVDLEDVTVRNIRSMDTEVVRISGSELIVSALWLDSDTPGGGWTVQLPRAPVVSIDKRVLDVWRTAAVVGGTLFGTYLGWDSLSGTSSGTGIEDDRGQIR
ncbi:MAG: hypothetical protein OXI46_06355 [Gemmatimonadota bacterium]|nr:hypothetical protein [Gemmatimonadota bacterium]